MKPERKFVRKNGDKVEEYYWGGKVVVYVNNQLTNKTFNDIVDEWAKHEMMMGDRGND